MPDLRHVTREFTSFIVDRMVSGDEIRNANTREVSAVGIVRTASIAERCVMAHAAELSVAECLGLLSMTGVGRLCLVDAAGFPVAFPVNFRAVANATGNAIVIRTREDGLLDCDGVLAGFEIDGFDNSTQSGWSVLVRGVLNRIDDDSILRTNDPRPWIGGRSQWMALTPTSITGRRLNGGVVEWAFSARGYL